MNKNNLDFNYDGKEVRTGWLWARNKWLGTSFISERLDTYIGMKFDAGNIPFKDDKYAFFIRLAQVAYKIAPSHAKIMDRYKFGMLKTRYTNPFRYYRFFMGFPSHGQRT